MRASDLERIKKEKYKPRIVARLWGGHNGNSIPADVRPLWDKHVKTSSTGKQFINQYEDRWYYNVFHKYPNITDFDSFFDVLKPYFSVQRVQNL
jgi:hypothetical protein